jgi:hypothetical protein
MFCTVQYAESVYMKRLVDWSTEEVWAQTVIWSASISACIVYKNSEILFNIFLFQPLKEPWMGVQ